MGSDLAGLFDDPIPGRRTMHEYVYSTLRKATLDGNLTGGTRLVQAEIASTMGGFDDSGARSAPGSGC